MSVCPCGGFGWSGGLQRESEEIYRGSIEGSGGPGCPYRGSGGLRRGFERVWGSLGISIVSFWSP